MEGPKPGGGGGTKYLLIQSIYSSRRTLATPPLHKKYQKMFRIPTYFQGFVSIVPQSTTTGVIGFKVLQLTVIANIVIVTTTSASRGWKNVSQHKSVQA